MAITRREWLAGAAAAGLLPMGAKAEAEGLKISHQFPGGTADRR